jgi:hypothetical protein
MGQPADRAQRVRVAVAQRLPLPLQRLLEQRPRLLQLTQVAQQIARVINRVQRVCVWRSPSVSLFARIASLLTCSCSSIYSSLASSGLPMSSSSSVRGRGTAQTPPAQPPAAARTPPAPERAGPRAASRRPARCTCRSPRPSPARPEHPMSALSLALRQSCESETALLRSQEVLCGWRNEGYMVWSWRAARPECNQGAVLAPAARPPATGSPGSSRSCRRHRVSPQRPLKGCLEGRSKHA